MNERKRAKTPETQSGSRLGMLYPEVKVYGLESKELYDVTLDAKGNPVSVYLLAIAEAKLTQKDVIQINELMAQKKYPEVSQFIKNADPWVKEQFGAMDKPMDSAEFSACEHLTRLLAIKTRAEQLLVTVNAEAHAGMDNTIRYFEATCKRSDTMVAQVKQLLAIDSHRPIALNIGAAHSSEVEKGLKEAGITYFLMSPEALNSKNGSLTLDQFKRKNEGKWALDSPGTLGGLLNSHHHVPPIIETTTGKSYASALMATILVSRAIEMHGVVPDELIAKLKALPEFRVDPASFERKDGPEQAKPDIIFRMWLKTTSGDEKEVWARVGFDPRPGSSTIEDKLRQAIAALGGGGNKPPVARETQDQVSRT